MISLSHLTLRQGQGQKKVAESLARVLGLCNTWVHDSKRRPCFNNDPRRTVPQARPHPWINRVNVWLRGRIRDFPHPRIGAFFLLGTVRNVYNNGALLHSVDHSAGIN